MSGTREASVASGVAVSDSPATRLASPLAWWAAWIPSSVSSARIRQVGFSFVDQAFSVGGMFLVNVALARTQVKEEYGIFALSYSIFTFLTGLQNASILEAFTVYGSGRYRSYFAAYERLLWRSNVRLCLAVSALLLIAWWVLASIASPLGSHTILGMALTAGLVLTATFIRRTFYVRRRPDLAARISLTFFCACALLLWLAVRSRLLNGFYAFLIVGLAWCLAYISVVRELPGNERSQHFLAIEPNYWSEHWKYSRWVLFTAFVFQFTTQGYYWILAGFLSLRDVANLRAMTMMITPMEQVFIALNYLVLPVMASRYAARRIADLMSLWKRYALGIVGLTACFASSIRLFGKPIMHFLYAAKFDGLSPLLSTIAFVPVVMGVGYTITSALQSAEKPKFVLYGYLAGGTATFALGIPLVIHLGLKGAVYGMLLSGAAYTGALGFGLMTAVSDTGY